MSLLVATLLKVETLGFGLVRDAKGQPRIDDPKSIPDEIKAQLTAQERAILEAL